MDLPVRKPRLRHDSVPWDLHPDYFITLCCQGRGNNQLCHPHVAKAIRESATCRQKNRIWQMDLMVLMPDHLHAILSPSSKRSFLDIISDWKRWLSLKAGIRFQAGFFDHRLRSAQSSQAKWNYVSLNPVRAGFVMKPEDWPYRWTAKDLK